VTTPVAIVVVTWNALDFTQRCLAALRDLTDHPAWRLVVVDNGSTDGTVEWLRTADDASLLENRENLGFSRAVNRGIAATDPGEDVVLLNNDVLVTDPSWLSRLQSVAHGGPTVGVVGARLVAPEGYVQHVGAYMRPISLRGEQLAGMELDVNQCDRDRPVESVVFAQVYLRRDCLDRVGPLDEDYFAYFEDTDFCLRARRAGFDVVCAGGPPAVHHQSTSTRENQLDYWSVYNRSQAVFRRKWAHWLEHERHDGEVTWHSVLHEPMGYAVQSRALVTALHFANLKVGYRNAYGSPETATGDPLLDDVVHRPARPDVPQIAFCQADAFSRVTGGPRVGWTMLEVTGLPPAWVAGCNAMDEVWVPASYNVETFRGSGVTVPIRVMPLGVDTGYFHPRITGFRPSSRYTFLSVFEWGERKAPGTLLRAFAQEFKESEDVLLLLAVTNRDPDVDVEAQIAALDLPPCPPVVLLLNAGFATPQMGSLYRSADCFVLPTRGEGWGMPVLEAMACGLPAIATNWSGPADFLHEAVGYPLDVAAMVPAVARCPFYEGFEWAEPDLEHLRFLMREVVDDPERARQKGLAAAAEVEARHSWGHVAERVKQRVLELGG